MNKIKQLLFSTNSRDYAPLALRLALGAVFIVHGAQKLFGWFGGYGLSGTAGFFEEHLGLAPGMLWAFLAAAGEFFGGILVLLGLLTRLGALNLAAAMAVAWALVHPDAFLLTNDGAEYVITLLAASIALVISGGGALSIDSKLQHKV